MTISASCYRNGEEFPCSGDLLPGTKALIRCRFGYVESTASNPELICLQSEEWSHEAMQCQPECGIITLKNSVPWHVSIYKNEKHICGGTIISERVVISAAYCFSKATNYHQVNCKTFKVAAGKINRALDHTETPTAQIRYVLEVEFPTRYEGAWRADICKVTIDGYFEYQPHILPACYSFFEYGKQPRPGSIGLIASWTVPMVYNSLNPLSNS